MAEHENTRPGEPDVSDETTATTAEAETVQTETGQTGTRQTETTRADTASTRTPRPEAAHTDTAYTGTGSTHVGYPTAAFGAYPDDVTGDVRTADAPAPARRRGPDLLTLLVGLATLAMAVFAFVGELPDLSFVDPRWLLAGGAAVVGMALLVGNLRGRTGGRRGG